MRNKTKRLLKVFYSLNPAYAPNFKKFKKHYIESDYKYKTWILDGSVRLYKAH
jgi:hypothetical protein